MRVLDGSKLANSVVSVFPRIIAPDRFNFATTVESKSGANSAKILEPAVVLKSVVQNMSLIPIGIPSSNRRDLLRRFEMDYAMRLAFT